MLSSIWNYKSTKHAIFVAGCSAGGRFEMSTAEIIPYPTAGGAWALKQENGSSKTLVNYFFNKMTKMICWIVRKTIGFPEESYTTQVFVPIFRDQYWAWNQRRKGWHVLHSMRSSPYITLHSPMQDVLQSSISSGLVALENPWDGAYFSSTTVKRQSSFWPPRNWHTNHHNLSPNELLEN